MKNGMIIIILMAAVAFMSGCQTLEQALNLQKPTASLAGINFGKIDMESATLIFDVSVDNPYPVAIPLMNIDYGLTTGEDELFSGEADISGSIPAKDSKTLSLPVKITYLQVIKAFKGVRPGSQIPYKAAAGVTLDTPALGKLRIPLNREGQLNVPEIPNINDVDWKSKILDALQK